MAVITPVTYKGDVKNNTKKGGGGNDSMSGLAGADTLDGVGGNDSIDGGTGNDSLLGGDGSDTLLGGEGSDTLSGGSGNDKLYGGNDNDIIDGGTGNDTLDGGTGADKMTGGEGNDYYFIDNAGDKIIELVTTANNAKPGISDTVETALSVYTLAENVEILKFAKTATTGTGNKLNNKITGNDANNSINGGDGNDTLEGGNGNDTLNGGKGADSLIGGKGSDTYIIDNLKDVIADETANDGELDFVLSSVTFDLTASDNVENLTLSGKAIAGTGNNLANLIQEINTGNVNNDFKGREGNDTLNGGGGDDTLEGGEGDDIIDGGIGKDTAVFTKEQSYYKISEPNELGEVSVTDNEGVEGTDILTNVEFLKFADRALNVKQNTLTVDKEVVKEGDSVTFTLDAPNAVEGNEIGFSFDGTISNDDVVGGLPTPIFTVGADNKATITLTFINDSSLDNGNAGDSLSIKLDEPNVSLSTGENQPVFSQVTVNEVLPAAPVFNVVAGDNVISSKERTDGVVISGTADAQSIITLTFMNGADVNGETAVISADDSGLWNYSLTSDNYGSGISEIIATATDKIEHISESTSKLVAIQLTAPVLATVAVDDVIDSDEQENDVEISGTAQAGSIIVLTFTNDSSPLAEPFSPDKFATNDAGEWSYLLQPENYGGRSMIITATAEDEAGHPSEPASKTVTLKDTRAPNAPTIDAVSDDNDISLEEQATGVEITGTAEANSTIALTFMNRSEVNGSPVAIAETDADGLWRYTLTSENYGSGISTIVATATDGSGNTSNSATSKDITIEDRTAPTAPVLTLKNDNGDSTNDGISTDGTIVVTDLEAGSIWKFSIDSGNTFIDGKDGMIVLENGIYPTHTILAVQKDLASNESDPGYNELPLMIGDAMSKPSIGDAKILTNYGISDAAEADVRFYFISTTSDYNYEITSFGNGDVLDFLNDSEPTIINDDFTDGLIDVQWTANGYNVTVRLTGLTNDASLYGINSFKTEFGDGSIA
jgi:Ca2+-binding RTX toxin-like protein